MSSSVWFANKRESCTTESDSDGAPLSLCTSSARLRGVAFVLERGCDYLQHRSDSRPARHHANVLALSQLLTAALQPDER